MTEPEPELDLIHTEYPHVAAEDGGLPPDWSRLRRESRERGCPIHATLPSQGKAILILDYQDGRFVLGHPGLFTRVRTRVEPPGVLFWGEHDPLDNPPPETKAMSHMDGEEHVRFRGMTQKLFALQNIRRWEPRIREIAVDLAIQMREQGSPVDLMRQFAYKLPPLVVDDLLGVSWRDGGDEVVSWTNKFLASSTSDGTDARTEFMWKLFGFTDQMVEDRMTDGPVSDPDNLLDKLLAAYHANPEEASKAEETRRFEITSLLLQLMIGGYETTASVLGRGWVQLFREPAELAALRAEPSLLNAALHEILRTQPASYWAQPRYALKTVQLPSGIMVEAGQAALVPVAGANSDDRQFPEPERFRIRRENSASHIAFGAGPHTCIGLNLAMAELRIAFDVLMKFFPKLYLAEPLGPDDWSFGTITTGPRRVLVGW